MFLSAFERAAEAPILRFRDKTGKDIFPCPILLEEQVDALGEFSVCKRTYKVASGIVTRIAVSDGAHIGVLAETVRLEEPLAVYTSFDLPITEDSTCNVAGKSRLVFRAAGEGAKLFRLVQTLDGNDVQEAAGLLLPDGFSVPNAVRTTFYSGLHGFGTRHCAIYAMTVERSDLIHLWHMEKKDGYEISDPDKRCRLKIFAETEGITIAVGGSQLPLNF